VTNGVGEAFLAAPLTCCGATTTIRPAPTRDYYSVQAVFATPPVAAQDVPFLPVET